MVQDSVFINPQTVPVMVFDEFHQKVEVQPIGLMGRREDGIFQLRGEHYKQFVHPRGPLVPFRAQGFSANVSAGIDSGTGLVGQTGPAAQASHVPVNTAVPFLPNSIEQNVAITELPEEIKKKIIQASPVLSPSLRCDLALYVWRKASPDCKDNPPLHNTLRQSFGKLLDEIACDLKTKCGIPNSAVKPRVSGCEDDESKPSVGKEEKDAESKREPVKVKK